MSVCCRRGTVVGTGPNREGDTMDLADTFASMSRDEFRQLVDREMRGRATDAEAAALRDPRVVNRWYTVLLAMKKSIEGQLAAKRQEFEAQRAQLRQAFAQTEQALADAKLLGDESTKEKAEQRLRKLREEHGALVERNAKGRTGMLRFQSGLEETLVDARRIRTEMLGDREQLAERVRLLEAAIMAHRMVEDDPSPADEKLWTLLPGLKESRP